MPGNFWKDQAPDDGERARLVERDNVLRSEIEQIKSELEEMRGKLGGFTETEDKVREEIVSVPTSASRGSDADHATFLRTP